MDKRLLRKLMALDLDRLQEVLDYDPETGVLSWLIRLSPRCRLGKPAGHVASHGYRVVDLDRVRYPAHHLAWFHFYREPSETELDHKNLKKTDNRIGNLRQATSTQNAYNRPRSSLNTSGFKGVARFNKRWQRAKFRAHIRVNGKRIFLGLFMTAEEAAKAYREAVAKYHGEFARDR